MISRRIHIANFEMGNQCNRCHHSAEEKNQMDLRTQDPNGDSQPVARASARGSSNMEEHTPEIVKLQSAFRGFKDRSLVLSKDLGLPGPMVDFDNKHHRPSNSNRVSLKKFKIPSNIKAILKEMKPFEFEEPLQATQHLPWGGPYDFGEDLYFGQFKNKLRHGRGKLIFKNGGYYIGT